MTRFIVRESKEGLYTYWVNLVIEEKIFVTVRRSEAKIFTGEADLAYWKEKPGYTLVELPEDEFMARMNQPRLEGF